MSTITPNYSFVIHSRVHPVCDDNVGSNLTLIDTVIKAREHTSGTSNFAGSGGVTITHSLNLSDYTPTILSTGDAAGALGEVWVTDIAVNSFVVRNSGSGVTGFTWIVHNGA